MKTDFLGKKGQGAMEYLMTYGWAILVVMIVGVVLWQLGVFETGQSTVVTGWVKLQPLVPSIAYRDLTNGNFTMAFMNTAGASIKMSTLPKVTDQLDTTTDWTTIKPTINGVDPSSSTQTVKAGGTFRLDATEDKDNRNSGDAYDLEITVEYSTVIGGIMTTHVETGTVRGAVEA